MRISDWSSDVCSSDLRTLGTYPHPPGRWRGRAPPSPAMRARELGARPASRRPPSPEARVVHGGVAVEALLGGRQGVFEAGGAVEEDDAVGRADPPVGERLAAGGPGRGTFGAEQQQIGRAHV